MEQEIAIYFSENWKLISTSVVSGFFATIAATWAMSKQWYRRQIEILEKEKGYLKKQLDDKDTYAQGIMEIMGQRLEVAHEEPARLKRQIEDKETQLEKLREENSELLALADSGEDGNKVVASDSSKYIAFISETNIRSSLNLALNYGSVLFPKVNSLNRVRTSILRHEQSTIGSKLDLNKVTSLLLLYTRLQTEHMAELDIGLNRCYSDLQENQLWNYSRFDKIFKPFLKDGVKVPKYDPFLKDFEVKQIHFYLEHKNSNTKSDDGDDDL
ncbi:MAG: hypothetical protein ABJJ44_09185 [Paraglaciecola sp.]|uniref:hypothetical protein n=1 Tax=Paraglaciecola sp. TaxID=1920173 RepID=UPI003297EE06